MSATLQSTSLLAVKISQEKFNQALSLVSKAIAKHSIQPILSNVLLKADATKKTLTLAATDLDLALAVEIPAEVTEAGQVTVPAQKLSELVSKLPHLDLSLTSSESALITVSCGRSKSEIKGLSAEQFPQDFLEKANSSSEAAFTLPIKHLQEAAGLVSFASDKREANSILNGICLELSSDKGFEVAATDGSRLAYYHLEEIKFEGNGSAKKVIIPFRTITELSRMLSGLDEENIECNLSESNQIIFKVAGRILCSSLIEGSYPKYQQLIPSHHNQIAIVERQAFLAALERVSVMANEKTRVIKLLFEEIGVLNVSANAPDIGEAQDQIDVSEYNGQDFSIAFNVNYMSECLRNLNCAKVQLQMSEPLKPIIVTPLDEKAEESEAKTGFNYLYLLMPVQMR